MKKKTISIFICLIFLTTIFCIVNSDIGTCTNATAEITNLQAQFWLFCGRFKMVDTDEEYAYLEVIDSRFLGIGPGISYYHLSNNIEIKMLKPYHALFGIMANTSRPYVMIGFCSYWDYV